VPEVRDVARDKDEVFVTRSAGAPRERLPASELRPRRSRRMLSIAGSSPTYSTITRSFRKRCGFPGYEVLIVPLGSRALRPSRAIRPASSSATRLASRPRSVSSYADEITSVGSLNSDPLTARIPAILSNAERMFYSGSARSPRAQTVNEADVIADGTSVAVDGCTDTADCRGAKKGDHRHPQQTGPHSSIVSRPRWLDRYRV
jgi:hypothetical protein